MARRGYQAWVDGDVEAMLAESTEDFEFVPAIAAAVEGGSVKGRDAYRRFFAEMQETWETFSIEVDEFREVGDQVMSIGRVKAKGRGSELELDQPFFTVVWFRDGKVSRMQSFLELEAAERAAGEVTA